MSSSLSCAFVPRITARRTGDLAVDDDGLRIAAMPTAILALLPPLARLDQRRRYCRAGVDSNNLGFKLERRSIRTAD